LLGRVPIYICAFILQKQTAIQNVLNQMCVSICSDLYNRGAHCVIGNVLRKGITSSLTNNLLSSCISFLFR